MHFSRDTLFPSGFKVDISIVHFLFTSLKKVSFEDILESDMCFRNLFNNIFVDELNESSTLKQNVRFVEETRENLGEINVNIAAIATRI